MSATAKPWTVRLSIRSGPYHRVDGADDVIAVVKKAEDAIAIGALPDLAEALEALLKACNEDNPIAGLRAEELGRAALKKMKGER